MIGQSRVEEALLHQLDIPVAYHTRATSIAEFDEGVVVTTNQGRTIVSKYAIAADGARSFVRRALNIPFTGTKPEMVWAVLDTFIETDFPVCPEIITFQKDGQSRVSWIPRYACSCKRETAWVSDRMQRARDEPILYSTRWGDYAGES